MNERSPDAADRPRPGTAPAAGGLLSPAETALIRYLRRHAAEVDPTSEPVLDGWRYPSPFHLLLDVGRLFTPAPLPPGVGPLLVTFCYTNAAQTIADQEDPALVYVEGYGSCSVDSAVHHTPPRLGHRRHPRHRPDLARRFGLRLPRHPLRGPRDVAAPPVRRRDPQSVRHSPPDPA